jgi:hypothetical protein
MLTIRPEQLAKFSEKTLKGFVDRMMPFLETHFPDQYHKLGDNRIRVLVQYGIVRGREYGIVRQCDVCQYIALMFVFGGKFDVDASLTALRTVLDDSRLADSSLRIKALYVAANDELRKKLNGTLPGEV